MASRLLKFPFSIKSRRISGGGTADDSSPIPRRNSITNTTDDAIWQIYESDGGLKHSAHRGMDVLHGRRKCDGVDVVIKSRSRDSFTSSSSLKHWCIVMEDLLNLPRNYCLCHIYAVYETPKAFYVVMEKCRGKSLGEHLASSRIPPAQVTEIFRQILEGVRVLHANGFIHKDLKLDNVVVDLDSPAPLPGSLVSVNAKIIDFDTVIVWSPSYRTKDVLGSDGYIAPEVYEGECSPASDMFAIGVLFYRILTRKFPFNQSIFDDRPGQNFVGSADMKRVRARLLRQQVQYPSRYFERCPGAQDLIERILVLGPKDTRLTAEAALRHSLFHYAGSEVQQSFKVETRQDVLATSSEDSSSKARRPSTDSSIMQTFFTITCFPRVVQIGRHAI